MPDKYVVKVNCSDRGNPHIYEEYLCCIRRDQYKTANPNTHETTPDIDEAFQFKTLAAAEIAAVFVGGEVLPIEVNS